MDTIGPKARTKLGDLGVWMENETEQLFFLGWERTFGKLSDTCGLAQIIYFTHTAWAHFPVGSLRNSYSPLGFNLLSMKLGFPVVPDS